MLITTMLLLVLFTSRAFGGDVLNYLIDPNRLSPDAHVCSEENSGLMSKCVEEICGPRDHSLFPMLIKADEFESFMDNLPEKVDPELAKKFEKKMDANVESLLRQLEKLEQMGPEQLKQEVSSNEKKNVTRDYIYSQCIPTIDGSLPVEKRIQVKCKDPQLDVHPVKQDFIAGMRTSMERDLENALLENFYSMQEISVILSKQEKSVRGFLDKLDSEDEEHKKLSVFLNKHWGKFDQLDHINKLLYLKAFTELKRQDPDFYTSDCSTANCETFFDELVKRPSFAANVKKTKDYLNNPEMRKVAVASMMVDASIKANLPSEREIKQFEKSSKKTIDAIKGHFKTIMSPDSFKQYEGSLKKLIIKLDDEFTQDHHHGDEEMAPYEQPISQIISMTMQPTDYLYMYAGASLGSPVALISDHYIDPAFKNFGAEDFERPVIGFSLFSLKEPHYGEQIFAHELGHHFSYLHQHGSFSKKTTVYVDQAKACIVSRYDGFKKSNGIDAGKIHLEEEFADEFGFTFRPKGQKLLFCPLLVSEAEPLKLNILESFKSHPEELWRALNQVRFNGDKVPLSCQQLIQKYSDQYQHKKCL
jgi:hypothetical protein